MSDLADIIQLRKTPGVLILDGKGSPLFANEAIGNLLPLLTSAQGNSPSAALPEEVIALCTELVSHGVSADQQNVSVCSYIVNEEGHPFSLRAFPVGATVPDGQATHIMVLVEEVIDQHRIDFVAVQQRYDLSKRETEVLKIVCLGLSNRQIADRLFISEHTVKDHIKHILQAFGVASRSEIIAALKN